MTSYAFVNPHWDDYCTADELPEVFADLIAANLPFTITALDRSADTEDLQTDNDDYGIECLTAAERNPSLCRQ